MRQACGHMLQTAIRIVLALVLVIGLSPAYTFAFAPVAWANDAAMAETQDAEGSGSGEGTVWQTEDESGQTQEQRQAEEEARQAEEQRQAEDAARQAEEQRLAEEEAAREAEEQRLAEEAAQKERADQDAADAFVDVVNALPAPTNAVGADADAVNAAYATYDALTPDQKALVPSATIDTLQAVATAVAAARDVESRQQEGQNDPEESLDPSGEQSTDPIGGSETYYVKTLLLKWDKLDDAGVTHFVGDAPTVERAYRTISVTEFGEAVQLNGYYLSTDETNSVYQTADSSTAIGSFELSWRSSDTSIATVTPDGLVRPQGKNGQVTVTATVADPRVYQGAAPTASVTILFDGQEGKYVKQVEILDESGNNIGEMWGGVTVYEEENAFHQLHARVTWVSVVDGTETVQVTGAGDDYSAGNVDTTLTWNVSASSAFSINEDTGRLRCGSYSGNAYVTCTAVGGLGGALVSDSANVQLDTGVYEYNPADSLALKVVWEERPDEVVKEATYSYADLLGMLPTYHANATVVSGTRFGVISADGFLFKDVVNLVAVDDADVLQYRFQTADGYDNPISYRYLFESGNRYYFPNYELGGSRAEGEIVPPLLAYQSSFEWNRSEVNPNAALDEGTRFRLVFGCLGSGDANTSYQIYYINGITVVLKGGPSAGGGGGGGSDGQGGSSGTERGDSGNSGSDGTEGGAADEPSQGKSGNSAASGNGTSGAGARSGQAGASAHANSGTSRGDTGSQQRAAEAGQPAAANRETSGEKADEAAKTSESGAAGSDIGSAKRWRVYQMMNKTNSDVPDWDDENPMSPFAAPVALGTFAIGVGATGLNFRRRLK